MAGTGQGDAGKLIGRSEGAEIDFRLEKAGQHCGCSPPGRTRCLVPHIWCWPRNIRWSRNWLRWPVREDVRRFIANMKNQSEEERTGAELGVLTGAYAVNPLNGERIPVWVANYVLMSYGTGAIMAVPAHDERDLEFARKYNLPVRVVISPPGAELKAEDLEEAYTGPGLMINSGQFNGLAWDEGKERVIEYAEQQGFGTRKINYRLRDWLVSRQRYWGRQSQSYIAPLAELCPCREDCRSLSPGCIFGGVRHPDQVEIHRNDLPAVQRTGAAGR